MIKTEKKLLTIQNDVIRAAGLFVWILSWGAATSFLGLKRRDHIIYLSLLVIPPLLILLKDKISTLGRINRENFYSPLSLVSALILIILSLRLAS